MKVHEEFDKQDSPSDIWLDKEHCSVNDVSKFKEILYNLAQQRGFSIQTLGTVGSDPILLLQPQKLINNPSILVAGGFHGEEPAGSWGILRFLQYMPEDLLSQITISFLPLVNPTGFRHRRRRNDWGENPNSGFCHHEIFETEPSKEGKILMDHLAIIKSLSQDGFISLHEDFEEDRFYLYTFEKTDEPGIFSKTLRDELERFFVPLPDGILEGGKIVDAIIFKQYDGSFEDLLFHEGIPRTACTETPGLLNINNRIEANNSLINAFIQFTLRYRL